jgi:pyridoxal biosynthesis lyase PdxS
LNRSKKPRVTVETDEGLLELMKQTVTGVFNGDGREFEKALTEAMAEQMVELMEANVNVDFTIDLAETLADAMRGVLLQWLGRHPCCPREDIPFLAAFMPSATH